MSKTKISSVIAFASVIMASLPAFAGGTSVESNQITVINGGGNYANQNSNQTINYSSDANAPKIKLENTQICDITGNNNACTNKSQQRTDLYNGYYRGNRR
jgi:hypothetical protein